MELGARTNFPRTPSGGPPGGARFGHRAVLIEKSDSEPEMSKSHLYAFATAFRKFKNTACLPRFDTMGLVVISAEARDWGKYYQYNRNMAGDRNSSLGAMRGLISGHRVGVAERLRDWAFRAAVAAGLWRGDILNAAPPTTVLTKEVLAGVDAKTKSMGKSEVRQWGGSP